MAGSGKFTFVFTERDLCAIAEALEAAADSGGTEHFTADLHQHLALQVDERLHW